MLAMQYSFTLPADYDMDIVDRRISEKGHMIDGFPHLRFKAYLWATKAKTSGKSNENQYAPFYVWDSGDGLNQFLCGPGFGGLAQSFGWPAVNTWSTLAIENADGIKAATFATREIIQISPYTDLDSMRVTEQATAQDEIKTGKSLAYVAAFNPQEWTLVRFRLLESADGLDGGFSGDTYDVGYVSYTG